MCTSFFHKLDKYNLNIDLHTIFLVEINKYNLKIWAIMTYSVIFLTLKSVINGHYFYGQTLATHITSAAERQLKKQTFS